MLRDLSISEVEDWWSIYSIDPWGEERADMRMARQVWAVFQSRSKKELDEKKYLLRFAVKEPLTPEQYQRKSMRAFAMQGGGQSIKAIPVT